MTVALLANRPQPKLAKKRAWYVPGVDGAVNCTVAVVIPAAGGVS